MSITRRIILQQAHRRSFSNLRWSIELRLIVDTQFQVLFTPRQGFFSPFLHSTSSLSVRSTYLALASGLAGFLPDSTCPTVLGTNREKSFFFRLQDFHLLWSTFPGCSPKKNFCNFSSRKRPRTNSSHNTSNNTFHFRRTTLLS